MSTLRKWMFVLVLGLGLTVLRAQGPGTGAMQGLGIPGQFFKPAVGRGALYELTLKGNKTFMTYAVVGKEAAGGTEGYWVETRLRGSKESPEREIIGKMLMVGQGEKTQIKRMIQQQPGRPPWEVPATILSTMQPAQLKQAAEKQQRLVKVGNETLTVPAGTFSCEHYRSERAGTTTDFWVSPQVGVYGMVKLVNKDATMILQKTLSGETSHLRGKPQPMSSLRGRRSKQ